MASENSSPKGKLIVNIAEKGGVGKTTISTLLTQSMSYGGKKVIVIDMDQQADCTMMMGVKAKDIKFSIADYLAQSCTLKELLQQGIVIPPFGNVDMICSTQNLQDLESVYAEYTVKDFIMTITARMLKLITVLKDYYDFVFIDFKPGTDSKSIELCKHADMIITPTLPESLSISKVGDLAQTLKVKYGVPTDKLAIVPNRVASYDKKLMTQLDEHHKNIRITKTHIMSDTQTLKKYMGDGLKRSNIDLKETIYVRFIDSSKMAKIFPVLAEELFGISAKETFKNIVDARLKYQQGYRFQKREVSHATGYEGE